MEKKPIIITPRQSHDIGDGRNDEALDKSFWCAHFLAFPTTTIGKDETRTLVAIPQVNFKPRRLVVAPDVAEALNIIDIKVGRNSMLLNPEGAPGTAFPPLPIMDADVETMKRLEGMLMIYADSVYVGQAVSILVKNMTNKTLDDVRMVMWGSMMNEAQNP
jgi:hypothetical protein